MCANGIKSEIHWVSIGIILLFLFLLFPRLFYCHQLAPGIISLTGGWACGDESKQYGYFFTLSIRLDMSHGMRKSVFGV